jgi:hypothetical protein
MTDKEKLSSLEKGIILNALEYYMDNAGYITTDDEIIIKKIIKKVMVIE